MFHEKILPYGHRRLRLKTSTVGTVNVTLRRQNSYIYYPVKLNRIIFGCEWSLQSS